MQFQRTLIRNQDYFSRPGRASREDLTKRVPELAALSSKSIALFGLGCLGAPSAIEFARAAIGSLRIVDDDIVDPGTTARWPLGLSASGQKKVKVIAGFLRREYPFTQVKEFDRKLGGTRLGPVPGGSDDDVLAGALKDVSLIYDATAELGVQHLLSERARSLGVPYIAVDGTFGGWGGRVCCIDPARTRGCWLCFQAALTTGSIPPPPAKTDGVVQPVGCGDPTFTGAGFDLSQVALTGVRMAMSTLCAGASGGYPPADWDVTIVSFRSVDGKLIPPRFDCYSLGKHPDCPWCGAS